MGKRNNFSLIIQAEEDDEEGKCVAVKALKVKRFTHYGFGTFLENVAPSEVSITQEALDILLECPERRGLQGLEFWPDNRLAWGSRSPYLLIPVDQINVPSAAKKWIKKMTLSKPQKT